MCWKEGLEEWGWGQVMESPGPHAGRSLLSEEQWKGRSREGGCEERNVTAGQGGNRLRHLSITHAERPGNVKEDGGNVSEEATKHPWPGPWHSFPCCLDGGTVSSCIYLFGVKNMAGCLIVVLFFCLT